MATQKVTRKELDELILDPPEGVVTLSPGCHKGAGVDVSYAEGELKLACSKCGRAMFDVLVKEAPDGA